MQHCVILVNQGQYYTQTRTLLLTLSQTRTLLLTLSQTRTLLLTLSNSTVVISNCKKFNDYMIHDPTDGRPPWRVGGAYGLRGSCRFRFLGIQRGGDY